MDIAVATLTILGWAGITVGLFAFDVRQFLNENAPRRATHAYIAASLPFCAAAGIQFVRPGNVWPYIGGIALALFMAGLSALSDLIRVKRQRLDGQR